MTRHLLLDTDVVSFLFKQSRNADRFRAVAENRRLAVSFVTVAELYKWTIRRSWGQSRIESLQQMLNGFVVLPYSTRLAWTWAQVTATCEEAGRSMDSMDGWIAATAIRHSIELLSNNVTHFDAPAQLCGLRLIRL